MSVSLSKEPKSESKQEEVKQETPSQPSTKTGSEINPTQILIDALSTIKTKMEAQSHRHKDKILIKLKGAIELLSQN